MTPTIVKRMRTTQPAAPCGRAGVLAFARAGLNFPIQCDVSIVLMTRPLLTVFLLGMAACSRVPAPMPDLFPESVGEWHRVSVREPKAEEAPDAVPRASVERIREASYDGPGKLDARVYQMSTPAVALDVVQRWNASPDTVFFYADRFFVVVQWHAAERKPLQEFIAALQKKLNAKQ